MTTSICPHCKEHCAVEYENGKPVSNCCGKSVYGVAQRDEIETPAGKMPYKGAR